MAFGRPKTALELSDEERLQLSAMAKSRTLPHSLVARAKVVLWSVEGENNTQIAERLQWTKATVGKWRKRFIDHRLAGLYDELRPGRPRTIEEERVAALLKRTLSRKPPAGTHWTVRLAAQASGISKSTVHRLFQAFAVQPHRTRSFKLSNDPFFVEKVRDIVGLYLNPPDHAVVLCVDEKSQIQALNRTQPVFRWGWVTSRASLTITCATERPRYSRHSTLPLEPSLQNANRAIGTRSFCPSCGGWMPAFRNISRSISLWTITLRTSMRRCAPGLHSEAAIMSTTPRHILRG